MVQRSLLKDCDGQSGVELFMEGHCENSQEEKHHSRREWRGHSHQKGMYGSVGKVPPSWTRSPLWLLWLMKVFWSL